MKRRKKYVRVSGYIRKDGKRVFQYARRVPEKGKKVGRKEDENLQEPLFTFEEE